MGRHIRIVRHKADLPAVAALQALQAGPPQAENSSAFKVVVALRAPDLKGNIPARGAVGPPPN
jgi:hypothetical protein